MECRNCGAERATHGRLCAACVPPISGREAWRRRRRELQMRAAARVLVVVAILGGLGWGFHRWVKSASVDVAGRPVAAKRVAAVPSRAARAAAPSPRVGAAAPRPAATRPPMRDVPQVAAQATPSPVPSVPKPAAAWTPPPGPALTAATPAQTAPPPGAPTVLSGNGQTDLVVGIVRMQKYNQSCVIWGFVYNRTGRKFDIDMQCKLRDSDGDLCQKSTVQYQGQEWTLHHDDMLLFWPAFSWSVPDSQTVEGYGHPTIRPKELGEFEVSVGRKVFKLQPVDGMTSAGPMASLPADLQSRLRMQLGAFPDNYIGIP